MAHRARLLALGMTNARAREEYLRIAEKIEAAASTEEKDQSLSAGSAPEEPSSDGRSNGGFALTFKVAPF